jgi:hypothetical protein
MYTVIDLVSCVELASFGSPGCTPLNIPLLFFIRTAVSLPVAVILRRVILRILPTRIRLGFFVLLLFTNTAIAIVEPFLALFLVAHSGAGFMI